MLKYGAVKLTKEGAIYGDLAHCPLDDLLESAHELDRLALLFPEYKPNGMSKDCDGDCYLHTSLKKGKLNVALESGFDRPATLLSVNWPLKPEPYLALIGYIYKGKAQRFYGIEIGKVLNDA